MNEQERGTSFVSVRELHRRLHDGTFGEILEDWKWIFSYSKRYKGAIAFYTISGILSTTFGLIASVLSKYTIDIITGKDSSRLWELFFIMVGSTLFSLLFQSLVNRISVKLGIRIGNDIQADVFSKIVDSDWSALNGYQSGDIVNRFNNDVGTVSTNAVSWLPTIVISMYRFIATFLVLMHYDWVIAVFALGSAPILLLASRVLISKQREHGKKLRKVGSDMMSFQVETFYNLDTIKSFGITDQYYDRLLDQQSRFKKASLDYNLFTIRTNIFMTLSGSLVSMATFGYCLYQLWTDEAFTYGTMTLFLQQSNGLAKAFNSLVGIIPNFMNGSLSAQRIRELVELPKEKHLSDDNHVSDQAEDGLSVEIDKFAFAYREGENVLQSDSFTAKPGEIVAVVGASGEGKTTLLRLLLALIYPQEGSAVLRGADGTTLPLNAETRKLIAYVPQGNTVLSGTIADNLRMGSAEATEEEMREALSLACALEFVEKLPDGLETELGRRGKGLSEGQSQRIAIARALLRDAPILLLDEATSALDVATERRVLKNLMTQTPNKTCIITTHRPSVLSLCSRVYRVEQHRVYELDPESSQKLAMEF